MYLGYPWMPYICVSVPGTTKDPHRWLGAPPAAQPSIPRPGPSFHPPILPSWGEMHIDEMWISDMAHFEMIGPLGLSYKPKSIYKYWLTILPTNCLTLIITHFKQKKHGLFSSHQDEPSRVCVSWRDGVFVATVVCFLLDSLVSMIAMGSQQQNSKP